MGLTQRYRFNKREEKYVKFLFVYHYICLTIESLKLTKFLCNFGDIQFNVSGNHAYRELHRFWQKFLCFVIVVELVSYKSSQQFSFFIFLISYRPSALLHSVRHEIYHCNLSNLNKGIVTPLPPSPSRKVVSFT